MKKYLVVSISLLLFSFFSCKKDQVIEQSLNDLSIEEAVNKLKTPLTSKPLRWKDEDLSFLDNLGSKSIIGLGETTHGSRDFFQTKHRFFQYLVENQGFKTFAMEADFGESIFINEAIQQSNTSAIRGLMKEKMLYSWVWKTEEVAIFLEWMSEYNKGKADEDKVQYIGIDMVADEYYSNFLASYIDETSPNLLPIAAPILADAKRLIGRGAQSSKEELIQLESDLEKLFTGFSNEKERIIQVSSAKAFELNSQYFRVLFQIIENRQTTDFTKFPRDKFMAENVLWYQNFLDGQKMVISAHDLHVGNITNDIKAPLAFSSAMGSFLKTQLGEEYQIIGFSFSGGKFNARQSFRNNPPTDPMSSSWFLPIEEGAINGQFYTIEDPAFIISTKELAENLAWRAFERNASTKIIVGAVFYPESRQVHLFPYKSAHFDYLMHFKIINPTIIFEQ